MACCALVSSDGPYARMGAAIRQAAFSHYGNTSGPPTRDNHVATATFNAALLMLQYEDMPATGPKAARRQTALTDLAEACRQGLDGPASDALLECGDWAGVGPAPQHPLADWDTTADRARGG